MDGYVGDDSGVRHRISRLWVGDSQGVPREVRKAWVGDDTGVPKLWYDKYAGNSVDITFVDADLFWIKVAWTEQGTFIDNFKLYRNGNLIYSGTALEFTDNGVLPSTSYTYLLEGYSGTSLVATDTVVGTTDVGGTVDITLTSKTFYSVTTSWTKTGGVDNYRLYRNGALVYQGTATTFVDTNLNASTSYTYKLDGYVSTALVATDSVTTTTNAVPAISITKTGSTWDTITVGWTGGYYVALYRDNAYLTEGTGTSYTDVNLNASTNYTYRIDVYTPDGVMRIQRSVVAGTNARQGMGFRVLADYGQLYFDWNDPNGGSVNSYQVWQYSPAVTHIGTYAGPGSGSGYHQGLPNDYWSYYELTAFRGGQVIHKEQAGARTHRQQTGSAAPAGGCGYTGYRHCTATTMWGKDTNLPVSCHVTSIDFLVYGHVDNGVLQAYRCEPFIGNQSGGNDHVFKTGRQWTNIGNFECDFGPGVHSTRLRIGGCSTGEQQHGGCRYGTGGQPVISEWGYAEWDARSTGEAWQSTICSGTIYFWYWTSAERFEELRQHSWWDRALEDYDGNTHLHTTNADDGTIVTARVTDRDTGEILLDWSRDG